jgi:hypothetical protein
MIVDDERMLVDVAEEMLAGLGYEPVGFQRATERRWAAAVSDRGHARS